MSNIYIHEPPTNGKVLLVTSVGDIDVELWSKETPKACRNFIQLCMEGYYDGTVFHRVVKGFIAQGGDPTGSGHGGDSIYGKTFKDEFHSRLRFNRRGLVGMANAGPHDNGSQFFFTLGAAAELDKKHTLFGKVTGHTVYNMLRLEECDTDENERPMYPHKIIRAKILANPFDDIVPRVLKKEEKTEEKKKKSKSKATKNFSLLSFGEEAEEEEEEANIAAQTFKAKSKSSHDLLDDSRLSSVPAVEVSEKKRQRDDDDDDDDEHVQGDVEEGDPQHESDEDGGTVKESIRKKLKKDQEHKTADKKPYLPLEDDDDDDDEGDEARNTKMEELKREAKRLKKELLASRKKDDSGGGKEEEIDEDAEKKDDNSVVAAFKAERRKYKEMKKTQLKKGSSRESETLALLAKFKSKMNTARQFSEYDDDDEEEEEEDGKEKEKKKPELEEGEEEEEEEEEDSSDLGWMAHKLQFESRDRRVIDANVDDDDRYEIYDPRNPMTKRRREASKQTMKGKR